MNARLIIAIITSLIDEIVIIAIILWVLPLFGIHIPLWGLALIVVALVIYAVGTFIIGSRILRKKPLAGLTDMVGTEGRTATSLSPRGFIRVEGELWEARAESGSIDSGVDVTVIAQDGLKLVVRERKKK